ncbi:MAG: type II toxin-antitoxin system HicB family antitoxin [Burkholderiales bacterium]
MKIAYQAILDPQPEGGFVVTFPDLPDAITEGDTESEALFNAAEVLTLTLDGRMDEADEIPEPSDHGGVWVFPNPSCQSALLVRQARNGKSIAEIARVLDTSWAAAQRLENPRHSATVRQLDRVAAALGKKLVLSFE